MQRITKILTLVGIFIMVMVTNYHDVNANYKADYYLRTGSRNLLLAKSFHVDFNVDISQNDVKYFKLNPNPSYRDVFDINGYFNDAVNNVYK